MLQRVVVWGVVALIFAADSVSADDWPQWMGPRRDAVWRESGIVDTFPADGLPIRWRTPVQGGYSGPAVADGRVFVTDYEAASSDFANSPDARETREGRERILCLDADDGSVLWVHQYECPYHISYPSGPRATPTVHDGKVYTLGSEGHLVCLEAASGRVVWSQELQREYQVEAPLWGFTAHPLVEGNKLMCVVGGTGSVAVALNKDTGQEVWRALTASAPGYCPPTMIEAGGRRQLLIWDADKLNSLDPENGRIFWSWPLKPAYSMSIAAPRQAGSYLYASGIGPVAVLLQLVDNEPDADLVWQSTNARTGVHCSNSTPLIVDDILYGIGCHQGELAAVELKTGKRLWETFQPTSGSRPANQGTAFLVRHADRFFLFNEQGDLIMARLTAAGYQELGRFHVLEPTNTTFGRPVVWSHPAFANRCLFVRNDREIVCVDLSQKPS